MVEQTPKICLVARVDPAGRGYVGQAFEGANCAYYVDTPLDDEGATTAEAQVDASLANLELLFQEQLVVLAENATEQQVLRKGKAMAMDPSLLQDHPSIMVLGEDTEPAPTRPDELITPQLEGGSRWFVQRDWRQYTNSSPRGQSSVPDTSREYF